MKKHITEDIEELPDDVIPAFLSPDHILARDAANDEELDLVEPSAFEDITPNDFMIRESVHRALEYNRLDVFMQPIVTLPQRRTQFYELYGRLRVAAGVYAEAREYLKITQEEHIVSHLDTLLLSGALKILRTHQRRSEEDARFFLNVRPFTLRSPVFMDHLLPLLSKHREIAQTLIFEMRFSDFLTLSPAEQKILVGLRQIGCGLSVDHFHYIPEDVGNFRRLGINYIKLDADLILEAGRSEDGFSNVLTHKHNLEVNGIDIIVQKIEDKDALLEILDYDIKFGQGFLFGRPDFQGVYL